MQKFKFELITGPMSCGKTEELLRRLKRATIAKRKVKIFFPAIDTRVLGDYIKSRNGISQNAIKVNNSLEIFDFIEEDDEIIAIDELQFFDNKILDIVKTLVKQGKKVIGSGLELDFKEDSFGSMPQLLCYADKVDKLTAICMKCGSEYGVRTQRLINGMPAKKDSPLIMIGDEETYEARCLDCYELEETSIIQNAKNKVESLVECLKNSKKVLS